MSCSITGSCSWFPSPRASCSWPSGAGCLEALLLGSPWRPRALRQRRWAAATQGAYDNAYIPAVYFGALLSAATAVELPALAAKFGPQLKGLSFHWRAPRTRLGSLRSFGLLGLGLLPSTSSSGEQYVEMFC